MPNTANRKWPIQHFADMMERELIQICCWEENKNVHRNPANDYS